MSFWSRTGDFFNAAGPGNWLLPSIAWGIAKATGDEDLETSTRHDLQHQVQRAGNVATATHLDKVAGAVAPPLHFLYNNVWNRPISTLEQMNTNVQNHSEGVGSYIDGGKWHTAWNNSDTYSFGQATIDHAAAIQRSLFTKDGWNNDTDDLYKKQYDESKQSDRKGYFIVNEYGFDEEVNPNDPRLQDPKNKPHTKDVKTGGGLGLAGNPNATLEERKAYYESTWSGRMTSGSVDLLGNLFADPLNKILPGTGALRSLDHGALAASKSEVGLASLALETGEKVKAKNLSGSLGERTQQAIRLNNFRANTYKLYDAIDKAGTASAVAKLPLFFNTADKGALAAAFARTNAIVDPTEKLAARNNIMGAIIGDESAITRLATEHADLSAELRRMGEAPEIMKVPDTWGTSKNPAQVSAYWMETNRVAEANAKKAKIEQQLDQANWRLANVNAYTDQGVLPAVVQVGINALRNGRTVVKDSATGNIVHVVSQFDTVRPPYINLVNSGEGAIQLRNNLNRIPGVSRDRVDTWVDGFLTAPDRNARQSVVHQARDEMFTQAAIQHGVTKEVTSPSGAVSSVPDVEKIQQMLKVAGEVSNDVYKTLDNGRRMFSAADGRTATVIALDGEAIALDKPLLNTMLEDATHIPDYDLVSKTVKALKDVDLSKGAGNAYRNKVTAKAALDSVQNMWSSAMLLRPAYGARVFADDQARVFALLGAHTYVSTALKGLKNTLRNWERYSYKDVQAAAAAQARIDWQIDQLNLQIRQIRSGGPTWQQTAPKVSRADFEATPETLYHANVNLPGQLDNLRGLYTSDTEGAAMRWGSQANAGWARPSGTTADSFKELREAARSKRQIQRRLSGGNWVNTPFSSVSAQDIADGAIRFRPKGVKPTSTSMTVYGKPLDLRTYDQIPADLKTAMGWKDRGEWQTWIQNKVHRQDQDILLDYMEYHGYGRAYLDRRLGVKDEVLVAPNYATYGGRDAYQELHGTRTSARIVNRPDAKRAAGIRDARRQIAKLQQDRAAVEAAVVRTRRSKFTMALVNSQPLLAGRVKEEVLPRRGKTPGRQVLGMEPEFYNGHQVNAYQTLGEADAKLDSMLANGRPSEAYGIKLSNDMLEDLRASGDMDVVNGGMANWSQSMAAAINQVRKDAVGKRMLAGGELNDIRKHIAEDIDARREWANFAKDDRFASDQNHWLQAQQMHLDQMFPSSPEGQELLTLARLRDVSVDDLERIFPDKATRPDVHGPVMNPYHPTTFQKVANFQRKVMDGYFDKVADKPSLYAGRNRIYTEVYRDELTKMLKRFGASEDKKVPMDIFTQFQKSADTLAQKVVKDTLYDNTGKLNIVHKMRYMSPFAGATQDVLVKWSRLFYDDPTRLYNYLKAGPAFDRQEGNLTAVDDQGNRYFMVPKALQPFAGAGVSGMNWVVPKGNFNLIFQGEGLQQFSPGVGPMVAVPVNWVLLHTFPEFGDSAAVKNTLLPFGVKNEDAGGALLPNWWRYAFAAMNIGSVDEVNNQRQLIMQNEQVRYDLGERHTEMDEDELNNRVRNYFLTRAWDSAWSPISRKPDDQYSFYKDTFREYQKAYDGKTEKRADGTVVPIDARMKFLQDFPEYGAKTINLSENTTGINAYAEVMDNSRKFKKEIARHQEYGFAFIGAENLDGTYDSGVYQAQLGTKLGYGNDGTSRRTIRGEEAQKKFQTQMGWIAYTKERMKAQMEAERRGYASLDDKGAAGIKKMLTERVKGELRQQYPAFYEDFNNRSTAGANSFLDFATKTLIPTVGEKRPDIQLLQQYLDERRALRAALVKRKSQSMDAKSNRVLKQIWDQRIGKLLAQDPGFEQMYSRELQYDNMVGDF